MLGTYTVVDVFRSGEFAGLAEGRYAPIARAYVERNSLGGTEFLIGKKHSTDPLKDGRLTIPGGHIKRGEGYREAAIREALEEAGVQAVARSSSRFSHKVGDVIIKPRDDVTGVVVPVFGCNPAFWIYYKVSGKRYFCNLIDLKPVEGSTFEENPNSDLREPRFISHREAFNKKGEFSPGTQLLLELIESELNGNDIIGPHDIVVARDAALYKHLQIAEPEED